jgi:phytoene/squalene synthetase
MRKVNSGILNEKSNRLSRVSNEFLLGPILKDVSRSFYLTLKVLPRPIRAQIGLAYLLARAADTISDTQVLSPSHRLEALVRFREFIQQKEYQEESFLE